VEVDRGALQEITQYVFSPDSEWLAYTKRTDNGLTAIFLYGLVKKAITMATEADGSNDPAFDPDGKYLFFLSEREINPTLGSFELSYTVNRTSRPQALVLRADLPSPFAPRSDEAKPVDPKEEEKKKEERRRRSLPHRPRGLRRRVVPFPVAAGTTPGSAGRKGVLALRACFHLDRLRCAQGLAARLRPGEAQGGGGGGRPSGL
jgi:tricorn protease